MFDLNTQQPNQEHVLQIVYYIIDYINNSLVTVYRFSNIDRNISRNEMPCIMI